MRTARGAVGEVAEPLAEILERAGDAKATQELASLCREVIRRRRDERERRPWQIRLARACAQQGDLDAAAAAYLEALQVGPGELALEDELVAVYERQSARAPLIEIFERRLGFANADQELALRLRLADLYPAEAGAADPRRASNISSGCSSRSPTTARPSIGRSRSRPRSTIRPGPERFSVMHSRSPSIRPGAPPASNAAACSPATTPSSRSRRSPTCARPSPSTRGAAMHASPCASVSRASSAGLRCSTPSPSRRASKPAGSVSRCSRRAPPSPKRSSARTPRFRGSRDCARSAPTMRSSGRASERSIAVRAASKPPCEPSTRSAACAPRPPSASPSSSSAPISSSTRSPPRAARSSPIRQRWLSPSIASRSCASSIGSSPRWAAPSNARRSSKSGSRPSPGRAGLTLRRTLAALYCAALARPESALVHLRANVAATRDVSHEELHHLGALAAALRACNLEEEWAAVAERELLLIDGHPELRAHTPLDYQRFLREEIARILDGVLGDPERALERIRELCDDPELARDTIPARIHARLHDLLRRTGQKAELADRLTRFVATDLAEPRDWLELAHLREEDAADFASALAAYREAGHDPALRIEALRGRQRCAERLADAPALAEAMREELALDSPLARHERAALARRLGALCRDRLAAPDDSRAAYRTALDFEPKDAEALSALIDLEEARGDRRESIALHQRALALGGEAASDRTRRAALHRRLATLHAAMPDGAREAVSAYRDAEALEPLAAADERALALLHDRLGEHAAFFETFGRWCDRGDTTAGVTDHLLLARRLAEVGERSGALARVERALDVAPEHAEAWAWRGRLESENESPDEAIAAFERAASHALPIEAARYCVAAGQLAANRDVERGFALFERAVRADAASFEAHAGLTRSAVALARPDVALRHAEQALELARGRSVPPEIQLELALLGGRAARRQSNRGAALRLFEAALAIEADHPEALAGLAEAHFEVGDLQAAKPLIERRLAQASGEAERAKLLFMSGRVFEAEGLLERAAERQHEALALDPVFDAAHESLVRIEERAAQPDRARVALGVWARASRDPALRARAALRAAEHALAAGDPLDARSQLEWATSEDPELGEAWVLACEVAAGQIGESELRALCQRALASMPPGVHSARIALRLARLAEIAGQRDEAVARYGEAWRWDARCSEAALCESRLARVAGDWIEADGILSRFLDAHPDPESATLAQVHLERGRLLSGPLEAFDDAITAYRRALALQPGLAVARSALAGLLLHAPDRWREALALHREILTAAPTTAASLRALATLAERQGRAEAAVGARCLLAALGHGSREELEAAPRELGFTLNAGPPLAAPEAERLRRLAHLLRDELARLLPEVAENAPMPSLADIPLEGAQIVAIEDELSAPSLSRLPAAERRSLFLAIGGLFLDPGGNGGDARYRDALDRALGLWTRRKLRRIVEETSLESLAAVDHEGFAHELRALAAAVLLDRERGALRPVLTALLALDPQSTALGEPLATELGGRVSSCEPARRLLIRITNVLCEKLERGR
ncbi:MAG: tetratricopeptide repeat protein [Deltaproteobacteria bacterium]|nr:tetratricopeptide repeat protein [Deltaproteobacteria bacterium]